MEKGGGEEKVWEEGEGRMIRGGETGGKERRCGAERWKRIPGCVIGGEGCG